MAYEKKTWVDRQSEYPGRRKLTSTGTADVYDVTREEGLIIEDGDAINAQNLNALEGRIEAGLEEKAEASHTHSPGDLTEVVPISKGGTGAATAAEALANLGALPLTGGTLTGRLTMKEGAFFYDPDMTKGTVPTASQYSSIAFTDSSKSALPASGCMAVVQHSLNTAGDSQLSMYAYKNEAGSTASASIKIKYAGTGENYVEVTNPSSVTRSAVRNIACGTTDLTAGTSSLATGQIYLVYE